MEDLMPVFQLLLLTLPALFTGVLAIYLFKGYLAQEKKRRQFA